MLYSLSLLLPDFPISVECYQPDFFSRVSEQRPLMSCLGTPSLLCTSEKGSLRTTGLQVFSGEYGLFPNRWRISRNKKKSTPVTKCVCSAICSVNLRSLKALVQISPSEDTGPDTIKLLEASLFNQSGFPQEISNAGALTEKNLS